MTANGAIVNMPCNTQTADLVGRPEEGRNRRVRDLLRAPGQPQGIRFGNTGRNQFRGRGAVNLDMSLFRSFPLGGVRRLEFRLEAANVTNTPKFVNPNGDVNSGNFMRILGTFGTATSGAYFERNIRLGLRFAF